MLLFRYSYRSLLARARANFVTMLAVAMFVVGASLGFAFYLSLKGQLVDSAPPENILVLARGTPSEAGSKLDLESARQVALVDGIKAQGDAPLATREALAMLSVKAGMPAAIVRGIDDRSLDVHRVKVVQGAAPKLETLEVMVGKRLAHRLPQLRIGSDLYLTGGPARIVGVFAANGGPMEDEIWTQQAALELHVKAKFLSSMTVVADSPARVPALVEKLNDDKALKVQAASVASFHAQKAGLETILEVVLALLVLLSVVATSSIATTMSTAVATRIPELAAMVSIGIRRSLLVRVVLVESVLLATLGAGVGLALGELMRRMLGTITIGANPVEIEAMAVVPLFGLGLGLGVGVVGAIAPMIAVRRLELIEALR